MCDPCPGNTFAAGSGAASCDRCDTPAARCAFANPDHTGCIDPAIRIARDGAAGISCPVGGVIVAGRAGTTHECGVALPDMTPTVSRAPQEMHSKSTSWQAAAG